jgi:hypothetical protein
LLLAVDTERDDELTGGNVAKYIYIYIYIEALKWAQARLNDDRRSMWTATSNKEEHKGIENEMEPDAPGR